VKKHRKLILWLAVPLAIFTAVFAGASAYAAKWLTSPPRRTLGALPTDFPFPVETVRFTATDGVPLVGWYLPCPGATRAVVLVHGMALHRGYELSRAKLLREHGYAVLTFDTRACGESGGTLVSFGWYETRDLLGAMEFVRGRGIKEFGLLGGSAGAAAIALAAEQLRDVRWVVLEGTYPSVLTELDRDSRLYTGVLPGWLTAVLLVPMIEWRLGVDLDRLAPRDTVAKLRCPVFVISGAWDRRVYPRDAQELYDHAREPKSLWFVPNAGHGDFHKAAGQEYEKRVLSFIAAAEK
jgi:fermentation-respiration switch protein FrsA (DUF1100 family)